jgi:phage head maturation protease
MNTAKRIYAEISKTEAQDDGTIKVWGYASSGSVDSDGETITADAMKAALPGYMAFGAVREMHDSKKAAGTAIEARVEDDGRTFFGAHVVDSEAVKKVTAGVYKGFSIGGKVTSRDELNKSVIKGLNLVEVSLVDRPANPDAVFTMFKAEATPQDAVDELAAMLDAGTISPAELVALAKAAKAAPVAPVAVVTDPSPDAIKKGMYAVAELARTLSNVLWLMEDASSESAWEGDNSPIPAKLKDWLAAGGEILKEMVTEEVAEMIGTDEAGITLAARSIGLVKADTITKAGAALSAKNKAHVDAIHKACVALGACDGTEKAAHGDDLAKAQKAHTELTDALRKAVASGVDLKDGDDLVAAVSTLAKAAALVPDLQKRVTELEAMPAPGKALLKAIGKTGDTVTGEAGDGPVVEPVKKHDGTLDTTASVIKAIHAGQAAGLSNS